MLYHVLSYNKESKTSLAVPAQYANDTDYVKHINYPYTIPPHAVTVFSYKPIIPNRPYSFIEKRFFHNNEYVVAELDYSGNQKWL